MSITSSSVLVEMNHSVWTAAKLDREATTQVTDNATAVRAAARVNKNLLPGVPTLKAINGHAAANRMWHYSRTLPWSDQGARLLPTSLFMDYKSEVNLRRNAFNQLVLDFLTEYPVLVQRAAADLGSLFDINDYPTADELRHKFAFQVVFSPLPDAGDFRLDVGAHDIEELKEQYESAFANRLSDAMRAPWENLHKLITGMSDKLIDLEGDEKKRYHETFITNAQGMCQMLTHLNVTGDPKLEQARKELEKVIAGVDIDDIRDSAPMRAEVKGKLDTMLKTYEW
ncbi:hypothetical protein UFOVP1288_8 [uncultured Caudovirales phage]|uniref:Uncharacterized protein n=1 Tax=uncultured Caudovirales phage TaxID=2100421 RepID=A0A6J5S840_9CAUD|nr:hypothetical protein UFOVP1195_8 [uncultured Caudovirales phage]CAB4195332.1 hypothetical protein UFOVP1288_8 [uncultured Caudovirales phage]CAB4204909.1 hypothetical protein UFOVP1409_8 [uncultured Caudovirales phage]